METQFLPFDYGNKKRLEEQLILVLGSGNFQVVEVRHHKTAIIGIQHLTVSSV